MRWLHALSIKIFGRDLDLIFTSDNDPATADEGEGIYLGTNYAADFSAWEAALRAYAQQGARSDDVLFFANDSFYRNFGTGILRFFLDFGGKAIFQKAKNGIVGVVDEFPKPVVILDLPGQKWVRSNFFFVSQAALEKIGSLAITEDDATKVFAQEDQKHFFKVNAPLSDNYQAYMKCWLFGEKNDLYPEYQIHWFRSEPLRKENRKEFERKFIAILSEHSFSFRAAARGLEITNVNPLPWPLETNTKSVYEVHENQFAPLKLEDL